MLILTLKDGKTCGRREILKTLEFYKKNNTQGGDTHREAMLFKYFDLTLHHKLQHPFSKEFNGYIHLIPKWRPINYSFVCMLISPLRLIFTSKFFCFLYMLTRRTD